MRRLASSLTAALVLALGLALGLAGPAHAGGPTSVMLVNAGSGDAAALYATNPDYRALDQAIGDGEQTAPPTESALGGPEGRQITVTWLQHDVHVWRVDSVYLEARGGPLVARGTGEDALTSQRWRRVESPRRLASLLDRLGVAEEPRAQNDWYMPQQPAVAPAGEEPAKATPAPAPAAEPTAATNWWWTLPGLATGALLTTAATHLRRPRTPAPRNELLDLTP